jgi:FlaA1/EpsC-like NDP-sugar epimerase
MIRLSGLVPGEDIEIIYSGLRPGEKLYEELLAGAEDTLPTHHPRILIGKVRPGDDPRLRAFLDDLPGLIRNGEADTAVRRMKELVPEYRSHNSTYSTFDPE